MKQVERYLCTQCRQNALDAQLRVEEIPDVKQEKGKCAWCGRSCYGFAVRISYGGKT